MATFAEAAAYLDVIARRAEDAAEPVAIAMAEAFTDHVSRVTLRQYAHDRWSKTPAPRGGPPAMVDGHLAASFIVIPGGASGGVGRAIAGNTAIYAAVQQGGRRITVKSARSLRWLTDYITDRTNLEKSKRELGDGLYMNFAFAVQIPARPYFDVDGAIPEIEKKKIETFVALVWG